MHYTEEQIERARRTDLAGFMKSRGERLVRSGKEYRWKEHDSVMVYQDKWYRHSQGRGGDPIDFVMEFYGMSFPEAVQLLTGEEGVGPAERAGAPAPSPFRLPMREDTDTKAVEYLTKERGICPEIVEYFIRIGDIYQERESGSVVFVGRDPEEHPRYAHTRSIIGRIRKDVIGAEKRYNFGYRGGNHSLFVFEAPIDMLSYISLYPENWQKQNYICLGGTSDKALVQFLSDNPKVNSIYLCLDSDEAGEAACRKLTEVIPEKKDVFRLEPSLKDWNEVLVAYKEELTKLPELKTLILKEAESVKTICLADIEPVEVEWLWQPYIPLGKLTIIQGNPGDGKTFLAMVIAAALTTGGELPGRERTDPCNVIYQTAEDGLADTIVPRLISVGADLTKVHTIDDSKLSLSLVDGRLEEAIQKHEARLMILDPIQAFVGADVDMNRANEIRPVFRQLGNVAERNRCAIVLIGHLNKACGSSSAYRGLGSIDIPAVVRSVLVVGRVKKNPEQRMVIHDKSSLNPPGKTLGFTFTQEDEEDERIFRWNGTFDMTADELLSGGAEARKAETKIRMAVKLLLDTLSDGGPHFNKELVEKAQAQEISSRTLNDAKKELADRLVKKKVDGQWQYSLREAEKNP